MALTGEQAAFYQNTAAVRDGACYEFHEGLYQRICQSTDREHLLVVGHGGCGKSTELMMLKSKLDADEAPVILVEAEDDLDLYNFSYIDLFMLIVERTVRYADDHNFTIDSHIVSAFQRALSTRTTREYWSHDADAGVDTELRAATPSVLSFLKASVKITAALKMASGLNEELRREIQPQISDIIESLNALIDNLQRQTSKPIVIIIDGLEKCRFESVRKLFVEDIASLATLDAHLVMACPIAVYRLVDEAVLSSYFFAPRVIPLIKTHNNDRDRSAFEAGVKVIKELILKRVDASFFEKRVLEKIIAKSGGSLRDTCQILSNCAFEAEMRKNETIDMDATDFVLKKYANDVFFRVDSAFYPRVSKIYQGDFEARQDSELTELLYSGAVFEYNGECWIDLHPLVCDYIEDHPKVFDWDGTDNSEE